MAVYFTRSDTSHSLEEPMLAGHINYGPRLYCFLPKRRLQEANDFAPVNEGTVPDNREVDTTSENEESEERTSDESRRESDDCAIEVHAEDVLGNVPKLKRSEPKTPREMQLIRPLVEQLQHVVALSRLTSQSRAAFIRVLVDAHNGLEAIEDLIKETKEEVMASLDVIEERLIDEDTNNKSHLARMDELLRPICRRFDALQRLHLDITPLAKKVSINDTTTNLLRSNTTAAKQALAQMEDMDTLRKKPSNYFTMDLSDMLSQVMTAMSVLRETLVMLSRYMSRSEAWHELKSTMELRSSGIEKAFLSEYPATPLKDYLECCPSSSLSSGVPYSSPIVEQSPQAAAAVPKELKLEPWTSASSLTSSRSSYISSTELISARMSSLAVNSYELTEDEGSSGREVNVDMARIPDTLSSCSSFENAELLSLTTAKKHGVPPEFMASALTPENLRTAMEAVMTASCPELFKTALSSEDIRAALTYGVSSRCSELLNSAITAEDIRTAIEHGISRCSELPETAICSEANAYQPSLPVSELYDALLKTAQGLESHSNEFMSSCEDTQIASEAA